MVNKDVYIKYGTRGIILLKLTTDSITWPVCDSRGTS